MHIFNPDCVTLNGITVTLRYEVTEIDIGRVREIVESTGFFHASEIDVATELVEERVRRGDPSGYFFAFAERAGKVVAYVCYGPIPCTANSFDIYWIAVHSDEQKHGLGKWLMTLTEDLIRHQNGRRIYVETSGQQNNVEFRCGAECCNSARTVLISRVRSKGMEGSSAFTTDAAVQSKANANCRVFICHAGRTCCIDDDILVVHSAWSPGFR